MKNNPFRPTFGSIPEAIAGRRDIIDDILEGLQNGSGDPNRSTLFSGQRGSGKTVLLAYIAEQAESQGWISANVTSGSGMLDEIIIQTREKASHILSEKNKRHLSEIHAAGVGASFETDRQLSSWRSVMTGMIRELNDCGTGLLITIDEIALEHEELKTFVDAYQHFVREKRDVAMLLAGLPQNVNLLLQDKQLTFLRRAFRRELESIDFDDVAYSLRKTVEDNGRKISDAALIKAAESSQGFAYLIQLIGYYMWRQSDEEVISVDDVDAALLYASREMKRTIFDAVYFELSEREREFVNIMAEADSCCRTSFIAEKLGISSNNASKIRRRLIEKNVIREELRGYVALDIPMFKEYLLEKLLG